MSNTVGIALLKQAHNSNETTRKATIKLDAESLSILERWPLGRTLKERASHLIEAGDEYLRLLSEQEGEAPK